jgi:ParB family chromosome partitioning protein
MTLQTIPLNQLIPSTANVRKTGAALGIEELAASIAAHGLLQNLQVRSSVKGRFEVVAGGRRLAALKTLAKRKAIAKDFEVPCHVLDTEDAHEISLAENTIRLAMHPADQFAAFQGLVEQGKGIEEVAARFGVSPAIVRQRLKLASVSPSLIDIYRDDGMTLDQLMAFTVSDDHAAQESAWFEQPDYNRRPASIRANLTAAQVEADDKRVRFVGLDTYLAAGGGMNRDLFQPEHEGYLTDPALLERLVVARLEREADTLRAQGWKWVIATPSCTPADRQGLRRVFPVSVPLSADQQQERDQLMASYDALIAEHGDEPDDEIAAEFNGLWEDIERIDESASTWRDQDRAAAGVIISINYQGDLDIDAGLVRPDDLPKLVMVEGDEDDGQEPPEGASPVSSRLTESLTAERTAALRAMMMENQTIALATLCHALALGLFYHPAERLESCLNLRLVSRDLGKSGDWIEEAGAQVLLNARHADWQKRLPADAADLFDWLLAQDNSTIIELLSFCTALGIDAVRTKAERRSHPRLAHADQVATALRLDMSLWWSPTKDNYLGKVPKVLILEAVSEGVSRQAADNLVSLKKDRLIESAAQKLSGKGWLPALLRSSKPSDEDIEWEAMAAE